MKTTAIGIAGLAFTTSTAAADESGDGPELELSPDEVDLLADQDVDVGTVSASLDGDTMDVTYDTSGAEWYIADTHLHVTDDDFDEVTNRNGNPRPGQFDYSGKPYDEYDETVTYSPDVGDLDLEDGDDVLVAAQAEVFKYLHDDEIREETTWGDGERFTDRGNWATYSEFDVEEAIQLVFDLPPFGQDQFDLLTSIDLTKGDPETGERESIFGIILEAEDEDGEPLDDEAVTFDVTATNHLGTDPFDAAPNDSLVGSTTVEFEDGEESFSIGGTDSDGADLTLGFFGFLPEVNDVETIQIDAPDGVEIVGRTLDLRVNPGTTAIDGAFEEVVED